MRALMRRWPCSPLVCPLVCLALSAALAPAQSPAAFSVATPVQAPRAAQVAPTSKAHVAPVSVDGRPVLEANIGIRTEANFWVGFEDDIDSGGVFVPTYDELATGTRVALKVTLPAGASFVTAAEVKFVRDPTEVGEAVAPGVGFRFEGLGEEHRSLARKFIERRRPLFYDVS